MICIHSANLQKDASPKNVVTSHTGTQIYSHTGTQIYSHTGTQIYSHTGTQI